jgi:cupin fold WbuC family metalloprotein
MMKTKAFNTEVLFPDEDIVHIDQTDIQYLVNRAETNERKRIRICAHRTTEDRLHEMIIVHTKETYVWPHKHINKTESFHVIDGRADVVIFDEAGKITQVIKMGDYQSGLCFYYRVADPLFHTLLIYSDMLVFHEVTNGPFNHADSAYAPWAPDMNDITGQIAYMKGLTHEVERFLVDRKKRIRP